MKREEILEKRVLRNLISLDNSLFLTEEETVSVIGKLVSRNPNLQYEIPKNYLPKLALYVEKPVLDPYYLYDKCRYELHSTALYLDPLQWVRVFLIYLKQYKRKPYVVWQFVDHLKRWDVPLFISDKIRKKLPNSYQEYFEEKVKFDEVITKEVLNAFDVDKLRKFYDEIVVPQSHQGKGFEWLKLVDLSRIDTLKAEILKRVNQGYTDKQIVAEVHVSEEKVRAYRKFFEKAVLGGSR